MTESQLPLRHAGMFPMEITPRLPEGRAGQPRKQAVRRSYIVKCAHDKGVAASCEG